MLTKQKRKREGEGWGNVDISDKGRRGVGEMLTLADKGGKGGWGNADNS